MSGPHRMLDKRRTASPVINASLALIEIDRAITDLRRGGVVIVGDGASICLVQAAEAITAESLARFAALSGKRPALAITRRRAAALQLAEAATTPGGTVLSSRRSANARQPRSPAVKACSASIPSTSWPITRWRRARCVASPRHAYR